MTEMLSPARFGAGPMKVTEIMTKKAVCCCPYSSTLSAALLMQESDTGFLPVIQDPFSPTLVGVVTDRDLCLHVVASGRDPSRFEQTPLSASDLGIGDCGGLSSSQQVSFFRGRSIEAGSARRG